jgi:hypothetical protein
MAHAPIIAREISACPDYSQITPGMLRRVAPSCGECWGIVGNVRESGATGANTLMTDKNALSYFFNWRS